VWLARALYACARVPQCKTSLRCYRLPFAAAPQFSPFRSIVAAETYQSIELLGICQCLTGVRITNSGGAEPYGVSINNVHCRDILAASASPFHAFLTSVVGALLHLLATLLVFCISAIHRSSNLSVRMSSSVRYCGGYGWWCEMPCSTTSLSIVSQKKRLTNWLKAKLFAIGEI
jgi:hypothetical protein